MSAVERDHVTSSEVSQSQTQAETVQHVVVIVLDSFVSSAQPLTAVYVDEVLDLLFSLCTKTATQQVLLNRLYDIHCSFKFTRYLYQRRLNALLRTFFFSNLSRK